MFYAILKKYARLAIRIYCRKIIINRPQILEEKGPVLLACNHPNSFLDGIILTTLFEAPVFSLARGDAFRTPWVNRFLRRMRLLPVYRTSEGVENLEHNYTTFASCREAFRKNAIVLIFSEGRCENEWHLRPLRKGTARLAVAAWNEGTPLQVIPTAINYSSFEKFGKEIHLFFGVPIAPEIVRSEPTEGRQLLAFNQQLERQLQEMVYEIPPGDNAKGNRIFGIGRKKSFSLLFIPAILGWALHAPLYYPCKWWSGARFLNSGHYDSVLTALLVLVYPLYLLLLTTIAFFVEPLLAPLVLILSPLTAWACVQVKYQLDW